EGRILTLLADSIGKETLLAIKWRGKRLAVFDPVVQPDNPEFSFIYFVHGHLLTVQKKLSEAGGTSEVENIQDRELSLEQYRLWSAHNEDLVESMVHREHLEVETPPAPRRRCSTCEGVGSWFDSPVKPSYGVQSEGPNIVERCQECAGQGFVDDLLLLGVDDHLTNGHVFHEPAQKSVGETCILSKQQSAKLQPESSKPKYKPRSPNIQLAVNAGESLSASHPQEPYWVTASEWSEEMLSEASRHIVDLVVHGRQICSCRDGDHCQFLFALSLYSLADVRGNNYWPVAFEEVARRGGP
ncbi:MAG: hypothetical protein J0653_01900, partial [Deltaproteobacteria bacterium]|nr:hypothetical protein [Deltaproteobacteria bacterium]